MQTLSVLAVEDGAIVVASPTGERFRLPVDAALRSRLLSTPGPADERRLSPREIQAHVRSGLTAEQVAAMTGVSVASIERFVGPVLAERAYIVESALAVRLPPETEGARSRTFGAVMGERLDALAAREVRWSSAKEPSGWILAVRFTADDVPHDARWRFDAKHMRLDADNVEASTLSQQGVPPALTPRLRAIEPTAPVAIVAPAPAAAVRRAPEPAEQPDRSRFDSAAFRFPPVERAAADEGEQSPAAVRRRNRTAPRAAEPDDGLPETKAMDVVTGPARDGEVFAPRPAPAGAAAAPTRRTAQRAEAGDARRADATRGDGPRTDAPVTQLRRHVEQAPVEDRPTEPLRRRRERASTGPGPRGQAAQPAGRPVGAPGRDDAQPTAPVPPLEPGGDRSASARARRGRTSMPSWDEIVFGRDEPS